MLRHGSCVLPAVAVLLLSGCFAPPSHPNSPRLPTVGWGRPEFERQAYERQDPFPDNSLGPDTQARPRGYNLQRTDSRRLSESYMRLRAQGQLNRDPYRPQPQPPTIGSRYPQTVNP